ncbi:MAG: HYR-like domain-containing protein, partial [Mesonia hippocampi]|uniref:HYR-like domain-containing protein n=1 Tax=Mesonia hippocampi TaxID=1628250 RepID=UPI003F9C78E1
MKNNYQTSFFLKSIICLVFALWVTSSSKAQAQTPTPSNGILYVNKAVSGGNGSGDSWANAIPELADALKWTRTENEADNNWLQNDSLQVFVAKGTYLPLYNAADGQYTNNGNRDNAFVMVKNVQLYGGFDPANNITDLTHTRDFSETTGSILSGDFNNDDVVTGGGASLSFSNNTENAHHIVIATDDVGSALLDGFSLIGGNADGNISTNITVNGQIIWKADGGGIYNHSSSPSLSNLTITENTAAINGGGMCNEYSSPILTNITFVKNEANHGGGIHNFHYSSPSLTNIIITKNKALDNGGGIRNNNNSSPNLINVNVSNNTAINWGGGMNNTNSSPSLTNVSIVNNTANYGGGVYNRDSSSPSLTNVSITNNTATNSGGGMRNFSSSPSLTNVSIVNNTATNNGGGMFNSSSSPTINNTIVWGGITDDNSSHTAKHSLIQGKSDTTNGNINATSLNDTDIFTDPANGDYNLKNGSPAINTGSNSLYTNAGGDLNNDTDLAGNPRLFGNTIDIGAFERQNVPPTAICKNITVQLDANGQISITASDVDDGSSDLEGNVTLSIDKTDFDCSNIGDNTVILTVEDSSGATATCQAIVTVKDITAPAPDNLTLADITAECKVFESDVTIPTATDNCGETIYGTHNLTFPISTQGTHVITWTFDDGNGNADTQTQNIIINDVTAPTPDNLTLADITAECQVLATDVPVPTATDNCGETIYGTHNLTFPISTQGTHVITWTFDDGNGNADTQTQNIIINDVTAPTPDNLTLADITA